MRSDLDLGLSLWAATAPPGPEAAPLVGDVRAQVVVVGGGFTGASTALHLAQKGVDVVVLEGREFGWGGSGRNVGLCNAGLFVDPEVIVQHYGESVGPRAVEGLGNAPLLVRKLIETHGIDCDAGKSSIVKGAHNARALGEMTETVRQWRRLGAPVDLLDAADVARLTGTTRYVGGLTDRRSFTLQPLSYARGLAKAAQRAGARLHAPSPVRRLEPKGDEVRVVTDTGSVTAGRVVLATGAYDETLIPELARAFIPVGYFMFTTDPISHNLRQVIMPQQRAVYDTQPSLLAVRYDRDYRILVGNLGWRPDMGTGAQWAGRALRDLFPEVGGIEFTRGWGGTLDLTDDHMPWIARPMPRVHVIGGYNGRGIAPGTYWGRVLADWVTGAPDESLPVPVETVPAIRARWAKQQFYANAFRAYRFRTRFGRPPRGRVTSAGT